MRKLGFEDKEFEKNKKEILRRIKTDKFNLGMIGNGDEDISPSNSNVGPRRYAWEYEIEEYRKKKNLERFYKIGAFSGVASLIITIIDKFKPIRELTHIAISYILK
ncbi:MAG: hypothetical protein MJA82_02350 [Clostridia bacterium]|nr:hypothetical protein [Clostridia bacterium]